MRPCLGGRHRHVCVDRLRVKPHVRASLNAGWIILALVVYHDRLAGCIILSAARALQTRVHRLPVKIVACAMRPILSPTSVLEKLLTLVLQFYRLQRVLACFGTLVADI